VQVLEDEGVKKFEDSWEELIESVARHLQGAGADVGPTGAASPAGADRAETAR